VRITVIGVGPTGPSVVNELVNEPVNERKDADLDADPAVPAP
jgi:cell division GTPase FtsZ